MLLEGIPLSLVDVGPVGLLVVVVSLVVLGLYRRKLVPEKDLIDEQTEKKEWRTAYERAELARAEQEKQVGELITAVAKNTELAELSVAMLQAMRDRADR